MHCFNQNQNVMKRFLLSVFTLIIAIQSFSLEIPKGTLYFDNSKTRYSNVKFVYGSDVREESYILSMTNLDNNQWSINIPQTVGDMYRYTFAATSLPDGERTENFNHLKDYISNTLGEYRTATTAEAIPVGWIFTPATGDNWAQGSWQPLGSSGQAYSGTLPILYINTEGGAPIESKEVYLQATCYIDALSLDGYESLGSEDAPLALQIKGRGNYTWKDFDKKPYRLKFSEKAALLGMKKSKHFTLLAHADDDLAFLRNTVGFELSRILGLAYTPAQQPVELVLNNEYRGLYFITEQIRVDKNRVNIVEQEDNEVVPENVTGGWLLEIDNYDDEAQLRMTEGNGATLRFTYHSPEVLSDIQYNYLSQLMTKTDNAIYSANKNSTDWEQLIDMESLAKFYIVQEIMDNAESFHGSCYIHKDRGENTKLVFGPVWDFGNSYHRGFEKFIYDDSPFGQNWIGEVAKFPRFQQKVMELWKAFYPSKYSQLDEFINDFIAQISVAAVYDANKWSNYGNRNATTRAADFKNRLKMKTDFLRSQWGEGSGVEDLYSSQDERSADTRVFDMQGRVVADAADGNPRNLNLSRGIYVFKGKKIVIK